MNELGLVEFGYINFVSGLAIKLTREVAKYFFLFLESQLDDYVGPAPNCHLMCWFNSD